MARRGKSDEVELTEAEQRRLKRFSQRRGRTRKTPAIVPNKLVRTSAFAARETALAKDKNFKRVYFIEGHSVVEVTGGELGTQHRDALYALFRMQAQRREVEEPDDIDPNRTQHRTVFQVTCTYRDLLTVMGKSHHVNNLGTVHNALDDMNDIRVKVYKGTYDQWVRQNTGKKRALPTGAGFSEAVITRVKWSGLGLDDHITCEYGEWVREMFAKRGGLVALDADAYFKLRSDYAKSFWPFMDADHETVHIDEPRLAELVNFDLNASERGARSGFRRECRNAFEDMVRAGALSEWSYEQLGEGRRKVMRYRYTFTSKPQVPEQLSLALGLPSGPVIDLVPVASSAPRQGDLLEDKAM